MLEGIDGSASAEDISKAGEYVSIEYETRTIRQVDGALENVKTSDGKIFEVPQQKPAIVSVDELPTKSIDGSVLYKAANWRTAGAEYDKKV